MVWRLLRDGDHAAAWNMALDQAILDAVDANLAPPTLRLYGWTEPAITLGRFQDAKKDLQWDYCQATEIPVVRRPTGGRGILHGGDVTVSLTAPLAALGAETRRVIDLYKLLTAGFVTAFGELGFPLELGDCRRQSSRSGDCFLARTAADLLGAGGEKLIGSAMRRTSFAVLLQSSIRYRRSDTSSQSVFRGKSGEEYYPLEHIEETDIHEALVRGFESALGVRFGLGQVIGWEEERAAMLVKDALVTENRLADGSFKVSVEQAAGRSV
jgi:Lipoate-protein ligase A